MARMKTTLWELIEWHKRKLDHAVLNNDGQNLQTRKKIAFHRAAVEALLAAELDTRVSTLKAAAGFISQFDHKVDHPWRLSDVLLLKFNQLRHRQVRLNHFIPNARERAKKARFKTLPGA